MTKKVNKKSKAAKELKKIDKDFQQRQKEFSKKVQGMNFEEFKKEYVERDCVIMDAIFHLPELIETGLFKPQLNDLMAVIKKGNENIDQDFLTAEKNFKDMFEKITKIETVLFALMIKAKSENSGKAVTFKGKQEIAKLLGCTWSKTEESALINQVCQC